MSNKGLLIDSGPLVALLNAHDQYHLVCSDQAKQLHGPFYTTWPVITEAAYLLRTHPAAVQKLLAWIQHSEIRILLLTAADAPGIAEILTRYADQSLDFADATLMHLADREDIGSIFTIDWRHFSVFRTQRREALTLLPNLL